MRRLATGLCISALWSIGASAQSDHAHAAANPLSHINSPMALECLSINAPAIYCDANGSDKGRTDTLERPQATACIKPATRNAMAQVPAKKWQGSFHTNFALARPNLYFLIPANGMTAPISNPACKIDLNACIEANDERVSDKMLYAAFPGELYASTDGGYLNKLTVLTTGLGQELDTSLTKSFLLEFTCIFNFP